MKNSIFSRVLMVPGQPELAKVNRKTKTLYLSSEIWNRLPQGEKDFILFHEEGHLVLKTADEFSANQYAVGKFIPAGTFNNKELGAKILVMKSALNKADSQFSNASSDVSGDVDGGASGIITSITQGLSILGIGSKSRQAEATATAQANATLLNAQANATAAKSKTTTTILLIGGVFVILGIVLYFILRKK